MGTTLWHHCPESLHGQVERTMNDYTLINFVESGEGKKTSACSFAPALMSILTGGAPPKKRRLRAADTNRWHAEEVEWLKTEISKAKDAGEAVVVFTHHLPSNKSIDPTSLCGLIAASY